MFVQPSLMVIVGIWSPSKNSWLQVLRISFISKHHWWLLLGFDLCQSILHDDDWDFIDIQASFMMMIGIWSMYKHTWWWLLGFKPSLKTNFWWKLPKFGHDDNWNWSCDQFLEKITKIWSRWQLELVTWPIFGKNYQNLVAWPIFGKRTHLP